MRNAIEYDHRVTVGGVPTAEDLAELAELGFRTVVDLRDEEEKLGGFVERKALAVGLRYVSIPMHKEAISTAAAIRFCDIAFEPRAAPLYAFSRFGKRPLALMLLFDTIWRDAELPRVFEKAVGYGVHLEEDRCIRAFLVDFFEGSGRSRVAESLRAARSGLGDLH